MPDTHARDGWLWKTLDEIGGTAEYYCKVIWTRKCSERHWMSKAPIPAWHSTRQTWWQNPSNRAWRVPNYSSVKSSVADITYLEEQHVCLHKWFSGKRPILRKKWKAFEQYLFRYQTLWSRWCWFKPTSKWRVRSKKTSRQMTATDLWKLEKCRCAQHASPAQAQQKMDVHSAERHMQAQYPPYLIAFYEKTQQVSDSWTETTSGNDRSFEKLTIAVDDNLAHLC